MKILKALVSLFIFVSFFVLLPKAPAFAASLHLSNDRVLLDASDFSITTGGKTFVGAGNIDLHSDTGTPTYTTLEATWQEQGAEMRLYMYFGVENGQWKVTEIRTYNGASPSGDWLYYSGFTGGALGSTYTSSLDLNSTSGAGTGTLHFSNLSLKPTFVTQDYAITVVGPNGGEHLTLGTTYAITWNFANPNRTDVNQTFGTSIYLQKPDGTNVSTIVSNQNITKFNSNTYNWVVPNVASGDYKIYVYMDTQFFTSTGTQNLNDKSDSTFTIGTSQSPTSVPTSADAQNQTSSSSNSLPTETTPTSTSYVPSITSDETTTTTDVKKNNPTESPEHKKDKKKVKNNDKPSNKSKSVFSKFFDWIKNIFHFKYA